MESSLRHCLLLGTGNLAIALLAAKLLIVLCDVLSRIFGFPILKDNGGPRLVFVASAIGFFLIGSVISVLLWPFAKSQPRRRTRPGPPICICLMATVLLLAASRARGRQSLGVSIVRGYVTDRIDTRNSRTVSPRQAAARIAQYRSGHAHEFNTSGHPICHRLFRFGCWSVRELQGTKGREDEPISWTLRPRICHAWMPSCRADCFGVFASPADRPQLTSIGTESG